MIPSHGRLVNLLNDLDILSKAKGGLFKIAIKKAIVPVAGIGTRLLPTTKALPKEMLPVGRLPIIHRVIEELVAAGITQITGSFNKGENVLIVDQNERHVARGLASFNSSEINKIKGKQSKEIEKILGYVSKSEIIHKDDMVML